MRTIAALIANAILIAAVISEKAKDAWAWSWTPAHGGQPVSFGVVERSEDDVVNFLHYLPNEAEWEEFTEEINADYV